MALDGVVSWDTVRNDASWQDAEGMFYYGPFPSFAEAAAQLDRFADAVFEADAVLKADEQLVEQDQVGDAAGDVAFDASNAAPVGPGVEEEAGEAEANVLEEDGGDDDDDMSSLTPRFFDSSDDDSLEYGGDVEYDDGDVEWLEGADADAEYASDSDSGYATSDDGEPSGAEATVVCSIVPSGDGEFVVACHGTRTPSLWEASQVRTEGQLVPSVPRLNAVLCDWCDHFVMGAWGMHLKRGPWHMCMSCADYTARPDAEDYYTFE
jgi:hypothetical protein